MEKCAEKMFYADFVFNRVKEHSYFVRDNTKNIYIGTWLQGSQNYDMADKLSDVDTKSIIIPNFRDLILSKDRESRTLILPNEEHADVKDFREMINCWKKQNVNFVEVLFSPYVTFAYEYEWLDNSLYAWREDIAHYSRWNTVSATVGHMREKAMKLKRAGIARAEAVATYGYDPKQLCHLLRLRDFLEKYFQDYDYASCLMPTDKEYLIAVKRGLHTEEEADRLTQETMDWANNFCSDMYFKLKEKDTNPKVDKYFDDVTVNLFRGVYFE